MCLSEIRLCISAQIVADNIQYAKAVKFTGTRENAAALDFSGILEEVRTQEDGVGGETLGLITAFGEGRPADIFIN